MESQGREASPSLPAITDRSRVAILSNRTTDGTFNPVVEDASIGATSEPVRSTEEIKQATRSSLRSLLRDTTRAGRRLSPERSVNGNRARTMLPNANTNRSAAAGPHRCRDQVPVPAVRSPFRVAVGRSSSPATSTTTCTRVAEAIPRRTSSAETFPASVSRAIRCIRCHLSGWTVSSYAIAALRFALNASACRTDTPRQRPGAPHQKKYFLAIEGKLPYTPH